jgi:hypothetical protein
MVVTVNPTSTEGPTATRWVLLLAAAVVATELVLGLRYPLFRDELYYLACARHLALGYVDQPPLSIWVLAGWRWCFGEGALALRVLPALTMAALIIVVSRLARALGGGTFAQLAAAVATALTPGFLGTCGVYSMNSFDLLGWALALLLVAKLADGAPLRTWLWLGLVVGLGLLNKWSLLFFLAGLGVALLTTPLRAHLLRWQPWAGLALTAVISVPYLHWEQQLGWPTLEFIANASHLKNAPLSLADFALGQVLELGPVSIFWWLAGLGWLLRDRRFRALGIIYVVAFLAIALQGGKAYYLKPAYAPLLAAGAVLLERLTAPRGALRLGTTALVVAGQLLVSPFAMPVLSVEQFVAFQAALGQQPRAEERTSLGPLPQFFADRFGWTELTDQVAAIYDSLPPAEKAVAVIVTDNYGEAAALDYYGPARGLPPAQSQHNTYFYWGPGTDRLELAILVGQDVDGAREAFESCEERGPLAARWAMPYELRRPLLVCRTLKRPLELVWREGRHFI